MSHDYTHCLDYTKDCPKDCFRAQLQRDIEKRRSEFIGAPLTYSHLGSTVECKLVRENKMDDLISRKVAIDAIVDKGATGDSEVKCLSCGHRIAERPFEVYCNIMCKWVNEKDYCTMFEPRTHEGREPKWMI